jgi:tRNA-dihydrouridine synthase B
MVRDVRIEPAVVLAPMEGVTDICFRRVIRGIGGVGLTCTEFVASKGLTVGKARREWEMAAFDPDERPVSVQLFGREPELMARAARLIQDRGATIIDINMGCPSKKVCSNSGGSALMAEPDRAVAIVRAVRAAIEIPLTVKMRSGFSQDAKNAPELAWRLQEEGAEAIAIHWRTRADGYKGARDITPIAEAVRRLSVPVIANGDIVDVASAVRMRAETGCAGLMVGRGAIQNPFILRQISQAMAGEVPTQPSARELRLALFGYLDSLQERLGKEKVTVGRAKMMVKRLAVTLPGGDAVRLDVLRAQHLSAVRSVLDRWFDELERAEDQSTPASFAAP